MENEAITAASESEFETVATGGELDDIAETEPVAVNENETVAEAEAEAETEPVAVAEPRQVAHLETRLQELEAALHTAEATRQTLEATAAGILGRYVAVLRAGPEVVPELIEGQTLDEVEASLERARAAYEGVLARLGSTVRGFVGDSRGVPSGAGERRPPEPESAGLKPIDKIAYGLAMRERN